MKRIRLRITEEATYERVYDVPDDFDTTDDGALEELWCNDEAGVADGFMSVDERWIEIRKVEKAPPGALF